MRKTPANFFVVFSLLVILVCAFLISIAYQPPPGPTGVGITFLGFTNDLSGARLARFAVTNDHSTAVVRQFRGQDKPDDLVWPMSSCSVLGAHASEILTVRSPTNGYPWRVCVLVYPESNVALTIKSRVADALRAVGLKPRYRVVSYTFYTDWIESEDRFPTNNKP